MSLRTHQIKFRVSEQEKTLIEDTAYKHRLSQADMLRYLLFKNKFSDKIPSRDLILKAQKTANGVGNNLNQLMRAINDEKLRYAHKFDPEQLLKIEALLRQVKRENEDLKQVIKDTLR